MFLSHDKKNYLSHKSTTCASDIQFKVQVYVDTKF